MTVRKIVVCFLFLSSCGLFQAEEHKKDGYYGMLFKDIEKLSHKVSSLETELSNTRISLLTTRLQLARLSKDTASEIAILKESLSSDYENEVLLALKELSTLKNDALLELSPEIHKLTVSPFRKIKLASFNLIPRIMNNESQMILLESLQDNDISVRIICAIGLGNFKSHESEKGLLRLATDESPEVRTAAVESLGHHKFENTCQALIALLKKETHETVVEKTITVISQIGDNKAQEAIIGFLDHNSNSVKWAAINCLGKIGDKNAAPYLRRFLSKSNALELREVAIQSLTKLNDADSMPQISEIIREQVETLLEPCANFLLQTSPHKDVNELFQIFIENYNTKTKSTLWKALLLSAGNEISRFESMINTLINIKLKEEAEELIKRLETLSDTNEKKQKVKKIRKTFAESLFELRDFLGALEQYRKLDQSAENMIRVAICCREVGDFDTSIKTLNEAIKKTNKKAKEYIDIKLELLTTFAAKKDRKALIEETFQLLNTEGLKLGAEAEEKIKLITQSAVMEMIESKNTADLKSLGKKALPFLIDLFEKENKKSYRPNILEAANSITQSTFSQDILNDPAKIKEAITFWREWLKTNK